MRHWIHLTAAVACAVALIGHPSTLRAQPASELNLLLEQVKAQLQEGKTQEALQTVQQLQSKAPADYRSHYYLALAHMGLQRYPEAQAAAERALQLAPANARASVQGLLDEIAMRSQGRALIAQAEQALQEGLNAKAARLFDQAWQASPQQPELGMRAASLYLDQLKQVIDAGRLLWQVALAHPTHPLGKTAAERLNPLQSQLDTQARQWLRDASTQDTASALATLARAEAIAPKLTELPLARAQAAARGTDLAVFQTAVQGLARANQAEPLTLAMLPRMQQWLKMPEFHQFMVDLLGDLTTAEVQNLPARQWAQHKINIEQYERALDKYHKDVAHQDKLAAEYKRQCSAELDRCIKEHRGFFGSAVEMQRCVGANSKTYECNHKKRDIEMPKKPSEPKLPAPSE